MKKFWSVLAAGALISSVFTVGTAQAAPEVPATPNVVDLKGDANYLNDQGLAGTGLTGTPAVVPSEGDRVTPADGGAVSDILSAWFTSDADNVYVHIQTEAPGPATSALFYRVTVDPGVGSNCLWFQASAPGVGNAGTPGAALRTVSPCEPVQTVNEGAEFLQEAAADGTGIHTIKIPRALSPYLVDGATLATPIVQSRHNINSGTPAGGAVAPQIDNTKPGTSYVIGSGGTPTAPPVAEEPKEEKPEPKGCKKGKGKKKGCGKGKGGKEPKSSGCAAYTPGEQGADAETLKVTDANTAEAPLEIKIEQEPGLGGPLLGGVPPDQTSHVFKNLQVDAAAADVGLYIRYEFPAYEDHDLYVNYADGTEAAHVGGFNAAPVAVFDGTGAGGHSERGAEQIDGLRTPDCGGYTVDFSNYLGEGGEYTITAWLGEVQNEPAAPEKAVK